MTTFYNCLRSDDIFSWGIAVFYQVINKLKNILHMKIKSIIILVALVAFLNTHVNAQEGFESRIKFLPTAEHGVVKILYAHKINESINIKFMGKNGVITRDKIKGGPYARGIVKRYDVRPINKKDFWVVISSDEATLTYHLVPSKDRLSFVPSLESKVYHEPLVASNQ
jgi:hypothetical protein